MPLSAQRTRLCNTTITPVLSFVLMALHQLSSISNWFHPLLLRLPCIAADAVTSLMLWRLSIKHMPGRISPAWVCLFALNPISFMVSVYHGNSDAVLAMFAFPAAYHCYRERVDLSAMFFALAVHVKIAPLILSPIFLHWQHRGKGLRSFPITNCLLFAGWLIPLIQYPGVFLHNVFGYGSYWDICGITY
jgi:Gpi18-like mannosyltransferase